MAWSRSIPYWAGTLVIAFMLASCAAEPEGGEATTTVVTAPGQVRAVTPLPAPVSTGGMSLSETLQSRRSVREYSPAAIAEPDLGQLLWAAQGTTQEGGRGRTAPSAGGTYPLEIFAVTAAGAFRYLPGQHALEAWGTGDLRGALGDAAGGQAWVRRAPLVVVVFGVEERTAAVYGDRAERYVALEAGHACQNLLLQAVALGLGAVPVGAFSDAAVREVMGAPDPWTVFYLVPVGHPAAG